MIPSSIFETETYFISKALKLTKRRWCGREEEQGRRWTNTTDHPALWDPVKPLGGTQQKGGQQTRRVRCPQLFGGL